MCVTLIWIRPGRMVFEAGAAGLRTVLFTREFKDHAQINILESLTWPWLFEICPFKRLAFTRKENRLRKTTRKRVCLWLQSYLLIEAFVRPGSEDPQLLSAGSWINTNEYIPTARGPFDGFWEMLRGEKKVPTPKISEWLEFDLYEHNKFVVEKLAPEGDDTAL